MATATVERDALPAAAPKKLHGRAFYESIGSPKFVVAPMVDQSEFAWRMLTRSFLPESERSSILAYSPMLHARLFNETQAYRDSHFQPTRPAAAAATDSNPEAGTTTTTTTTIPWLDGNPAIDRPLIVQFCANDPAMLLEAARRVAPHCDAVDLNLGCPQGIARKGRYGAFLQEDQALVHRLVRTLHESLPVPVTAKIRVLDTPEATLAYARNILDAGASILTVHGRRREQKGHLTGLADWAAIRHLRDNLPPDTVLFANGNVLQRGDLERCLEATGADAVMSAEGNLSDPAIFACPPPPGREGREYWRGRDGRGGWRVDAVVRRYLDILHRHVQDQEPPARRPLFVPGDDETWLRDAEAAEEAETAVAAAAAATAGTGNQEPARKKQKRNAPGGRDEDDPTGIGKKDKCPSPNFIAVKAHMFHLLRHFISRHTDVRDAVARARLGPGYLAYLERILDTVERRIAAALIEYERTDGRSYEEEAPPARKLRIAKRPEATPPAPAAEQEATTTNTAPEEGEPRKKPAGGDPAASSVETVQNCRRPWWVAQPIVRPLPEEAVVLGALTPSTTGAAARKRKKVPGNDVTPP